MVKKLLIAVDFDGTIVEHAFPKNEYITERYLSDAVKLCEDNGIVPGKLLVLFLFLSTIFCLFFLMPMFF